MHLNHSPIMVKIGGFKLVARLLAMAALCLFESRHLSKIQNGQLAKKYTKRFAPLPPLTNLLENTKTAKYSLRWKKISGRSTMIGAMPLAGLLTWQQSTLRISLNGKCLFYNPCHANICSRGLNMD